MRTKFIETLCKLAAQDERIWLVCGDLGYSVLEVFRDRFPKRYLNAGVAEQNMTTMAAGLAHSGKIVFTYSIANFPVMRCLEQIRNDVCYHNLPVKVVAVGGGLAYGTQGYSHHGVEDLAVTRVLPNITVFAPGDPWEAECVTEAAVNIPGPCYIRLGKAGEPVVHTGRPEFETGKAIMMNEGSILTIFSTGGMLKTAHTVCQNLNAAGLSCGLISMHTLKPLDTKIIRDSVAKNHKIVTIEEHGSGGLGSIVAETIALGAMKANLKVFRLLETPFAFAGTQEQLLKYQQLDPESITRSLLEWV